jgi:GT2 family glycosyltransferase
MKLSVIIVNYNVKYFLEQALLSVRIASDGIETEVFVVDNNSVDDSVAMVREKFPEVKLIANKDNVGFSKANNQAIALSSGEYILLLNPDTVVEESTFRACIQFMDKHPEAGGLGVKMIDGSGNFLPESKRGFPSPIVAFYKAFGLSALFPKSKTFNHYHLGYLDNNQTHEIEVLAGAFMFLRKTVLDKIGWLDEAFFMYGEDIDLSYRIVKAGYKNYYFPETTIIHYKGESTKKGSLNYVKVFYNAMIIFAKKHFQGEQARLFILMLNMAIYVRATITLLYNWVKQLYLPALDALVIFIGLYYLKDFWASYYFNTPNYYPPSFMYVNVPLYIFIWLIGVYFSGGYDTNQNIRKLTRGLLFGTLLLAAVYGFLDLAYRPSRTLIVLGAIWALLSTTLLRFVLHFIKYKDFGFGRERTSNLVIVGSREESKRVVQLLHQAEQQKNFIGTVAPEGVHDNTRYLSELDQLDEVVHIYKVDELIFCSRDISAQSIMSWMTKLGPDYAYKIVPRESLSIIGSASKNSTGELYTIDIRFQIAQANNKRNKRLVDILVALLLLLSCPIWLLFSKQKRQLFRTIFEVLSGKKSWVGYIPATSPENTLPAIRPGIFSPFNALRVAKINEPTIQRLNFLYAKDYSVQNDLDIILKGLRNIYFGL